MTKIGPTPWWLSTRTPVNRWSSYVGCAEVYGKSESSPRVKNNELILFSCWSKSIPLRYEYLLQLHSIRENEKFYNLLGHRMNPQSIREPTKNDTTREAHYVYCQFTRSPFTFSYKKIHDESTSRTSDQHQSPKTSSSSFRPPIIEISDDSDDDFFPLASKKSRLRAQLSSSRDEDIDELKPTLKKVDTFERPI